MEKSEVTQQLETIFQNVLQTDDIKLSRELCATDVPQWDSLNHIRLIATIEKDFKIKFRNLEVATMRCVGDLIDLVSSKVNS